MSKTVFLITSVIFQLAKEYGPIYSIHMGPQRIVVLTGYEMVKEALVNQADAFSGRATNPISDELSKGYGKALPSA